MTDIDDAKNSQYRWVIHNLTKGKLEGNFRNKYMSTSLITNNAMGRYGNSDYGLIIKPKHIVCASYRDTYTLNTRDDEENLFNIRPPLMLPQEIEDICIQQTVEENGEMLNYETIPSYSELVVDEFEIEGVYYISYGEHELAKDYERAKKVADERGLPLIERDISKYRAEHGLEPMTDKAKMNLCRNILWKCCAGDRELEQAYSQFAKEFIKSNFKDFYEKFMQLKENPEFSKEDILRAFADVTRGDIDFGKISQNIDEMYLSEEQKEIIQARQEYGLTDIQDVQKSENEQDQVEVADIDVETIEKVTEETGQNNSTSIEINEFGEIIRHGNVEKPREVEISEEITQTKKSKEVEKSKGKKQAMEESIRNQIGDEVKNTKQQMQVANPQTTDLWLNRFSSWYSAIDRVSKNVKAKFVKMKSDIIKAISDKIKERSNKQEINKNQDKNER